VRLFFCLQIVGSNEFEKLREIKISHSWFVHVCSHRLVHLGNNKLKSIAKGVFVNLPRLELVPPRLNILSCGVALFLSVRWCTFCVWIINLHKCTDCKMNHPYAHICLIFLGFFLSPSHLSPSFFPSLPFHLSPSFTHLSHLSFRNSCLSTFICFFCSHISPLQVQFVVMIVELSSTAGKFKIWFGLICLCFCL